MSKKKDIGDNDADNDFHLEAEDRFLEAPDSPEDATAPTTSLRDTEVPTIPTFEFAPLPASCLSPPDVPPKPISESDLPSPSGLPPFKRIPNTKILVDAFRFRSKDFTYVLTHHHSDHYAGISDRWDFGPIYCSPTTARLLCHVLGVNPTWVRPIPINTTVWIDGIEVRTMDANHCPGAMCLLFRGFEQDSKDEEKKGDEASGSSLKRKREAEHRQAWSAFHCGDFRYDPEKTPAWKGWYEDWDDSGPRIKVDYLFLDNTYANPKHLFPRQAVPMKIIADLVTERLEKEAGTPRRTLFLVATYTIGKERVLNAVYARTGLKMLVSRRKWSVLGLLQLEDFMSDLENDTKTDSPTSTSSTKPPPLSKWFTLDALSTPIHVLPWSVIGESAPGGWTFLPNWHYFTQSLVHENDRIEKSGREDLQKYTDIMAFVPTGWSWELSKKSGEKGYHVQTKTVENVTGFLAETSTFELVQVPYSEHSSFSELRDFVREVHPTRIVPTVIWGKDPNEGARRAEKVKALFKDVVDTKKDKEEGFKKLFGGSLASSSSSSSKTKVESPVEVENKRQPISASEEVIEIDSDEDDAAKAGSGSSAKEPCPLCGVTFSLAELERHASRCGDNPKPAKQDKPATMGAKNKGKSPDGKKQASLMNFLSKS